MEVARRVVGQQGGEAPLLNRADLVAAHLWPVAYGLEADNLVVLCLNRKNRLLPRVEITSGTANSALTHPCKVFRESIREVACAVFCVHNHPSGEPAPSASDNQVSRQLREAARTVDVELLDHVILGRLGANPIGRGYNSFHEADLL